MDSVEHENEHDIQVQVAREVIAEARTEIEDATFDVLIKKPRRESAFLVHVPNDDGSARPVRIRYRSLNAKEYDDLVSAYPPTSKQRSDGATWNTETFPPALIAAVSLAPKLNLEQAKELYTHPDWAPGEQRELFLQALDVCAQGLNVPFNAGD